MGLNVFEKTFETMNTLKMCSNLGLTMLLLVVLLLEPVRGGIFRGKRRFWSKWSCSICNKSSRWKANRVSVPISECVTKDGKIEIVKAEKDYCKTCYAKIEEINKK